MTEAVVPKIGVLHPGAMGAEIGRCLLAAEPERPVLWAADGRSAETRSRAEGAGLTAVPTLAELVERCDVIVSVCPPGSALDVATEVAGLDFTGRYVDANAVSPETARSVGGLFDDVVDGGIVGPPPTAEGTTRLYLSGPGAAEVAALFAGSVLGCRVVEGGPGAASAVKMCFAGWTKGTAALLLAIRSLAEVEGVTSALVGEWETSMPELVTRSERSPAGVGPKAWRFAPEMEEIAASFAGAGLPDGFHLAAAEVYERMAEFKGRPHGGAEAVTLDEVLAALARN